MTTTTMETAVRSDSEPWGARPRRVTIDRIGIYAFLIISALFFLIPVYVMVITSLKAMPEVLSSNILSPPEHPTRLPRPPRPGSARSSWRSPRERPRRSSCAAS